MASDDRVPGVSIIIPAYRSAGTIAETVASVRAQTFNDYEIIVVDDASPDDTADVATEAAGPLPTGFDRAKGAIGGSVAIAE